MKPIRSLIVGYGNIAEKHIEAISQLANYKFVGLVEVSDLQISKFNKKYDLPVTKKISDFKDNFDLVIVTTPSSSHYKIAKKVINLGKNLLIEKPFVLKHSQAIELKELAINKGVDIFVCMQNRFNNSVIKAKEILKSFGKIYSVSMSLQWCRYQEYYDQNQWRGTWEHDGGVLSNQAIHHLDLLLYLVGKPKSVFGIYKSIKLNMQAEETYAGCIEFENNAIGSIEATVLARPKNLDARISLVCDSGRILLDGTRAENLSYIDSDNQNVVCALEDEHKKYGEDGHIKVYKHIVNHLNKESEENINILSADVGIESIKCLNAFYKSAENNEIVYLDNNKIIKSKLGEQ